MSNQIIHEITPLLDKDALYIADRHKKEFTYPIHTHDAYELNFVENAKGVRRIVGDNSEVIDSFDLVLITGPQLEHVWEQNECRSQDIREITIQFKFGLEEDGFWGKKPFRDIRNMMKEAQKGMAFPLKTIMKVYDRLDTLSRQEEGFKALIQFLDILHDLSISEGAHTLATSSFSKVQIEDDSRRILKVKNYINENYMYDLRLKTLADLANMSESAFSRFFRMHTGRTLSDYIIDIRLGYATRMLIDTNNRISDISFQCGYNNLSNFNRIFRHKKGCSPTEFRDNYRKIRVII